MCQHQGHENFFHVPCADGAPSDFSGSYTFPQLMQASSQCANGSEPLQTAEQRKSWVRFPSLEGRRFQPWLAFSLDDLSKVCRV